MKIRGLGFNAKAGEVFGFLFLQGLLLTITFGIYAPWYMCNVYDFIVSHLESRTKEARTTIKFHKDGGTLFGLWLKVFLLSAITFGIYAFWGIPQIVHFFSTRTTIVIQQAVKKPEVQMTPQPAQQVPVQPAPAPQVIEAKKVEPSN